MTCQETDVMSAMNKIANMFRRHEKKQLIMFTQLGKAVGWSLGPSFRGPNSRGRSKTVCPVRMFTVSHPSMVVHN